MSGIPDLVTELIQDFHGGIHPPDNKAQSLTRPIRHAGLPEALTLPLQQHLGQPAVTDVAVGERVLKGQLLAAARDRDSVPVHAPTSGHIAAIAQQAVPHPSGMNDWCLTLIPDGLEQWRERRPLADYRQHSPEALLERIREAGIAGLGGAGFATERKLRSTAGHSIATLILNGAECEPYISADQALMQERAGEILAGLAILAFIVRPGECLIAIEDNKPQGIKAMKQALQEILESGAWPLECPVRVQVIPTRYPSGGEKQLIQILTGQQVPQGALPADIGVLCQNVATAAAIYRALVRDEPMISRIVTLTGAALGDPGNREVLLGTPVAWLLEQAGQDVGRTLRLIQGGPLMGFPLPSTQVPVIKTSNCLIAATAEEMPPPPPAQACIRCGHCEQVCPMELLPQQLLWFSQADEHEKAQSHNLFDCIECGACAYVCPSHIPLVQHYRHSKGAIRRQHAEQLSADRARQRFEQRQARLEREKAEKAARREARARARQQRQQQAAEKPVAASTTTAPPEETGATAATGVDTAALTQRRDQASAKLEQLQQRLDKAREEAPESAPQLERALAKHRQRLEAAERKLAGAGGAGDHTTVQTSQREPTQ
ncbi:MAG: electron transport complex subunit RsxC [Oleiphilaceae bacterium]|nr:electron transport complex subunit RsxC [Oleiphilaceae bacterium]